MKKIIINEKQEKFLVKEAMKQGFSIDTLCSLPSFDSKIKYCKKMLGIPIGRGSSRMVFQIDDETVLKLAMNFKGIAQNEQEGQKDYYLENLGITPKVYHNYNKENDYTFIVSEYVLPAKARDFNECLGIDFKTFKKFIFASYNQYGRYKKYGAMNDELFCEYLENSEELNAFNDYMVNYQVPCDEILRLSNLGMVQRNDGPHIVILDSGLTDKIFNNFYSKKMFKLKK